MKPYASSNCHEPVLNKPAQGKCAARHKTLRKRADKRDKTKARREGKTLLPPPDILFSSGFALGIAACP